MREKERGQKRVECGCVPRRCLVVCWADVDILQKAPNSKSRWCQGVVRKCVCSGGREGGTTGQRFS